MEGALAEGALTEGALNDSVCAAEDPASYSEDLLSVNYPLESLGVMHSLSL